MESFYSKLSEQNIEKQFQMDFLKKLSLNIEKITQEMHGERIMSEEKEKQLMKKIKNLTINNRNACVYFKMELDQVNHALEQFYTLTNNIKLEAEIDSPSKYSPQFHIAFDEWMKCSINESRLDDIKNWVKSMANEFETLNRDFNLFVKAAFEKGTKFVSNIVKAQTKFDEFLKGNFEGEALTNAMQNLHGALRLLVIDYNPCLKDIIKVQNTVIDYNKKRTKWAEYIILLSV